MSPGAWFALGLTVGALAYPGGIIIAHLIAGRSVIYPQETSWLASMT